MFRHLQIYDPRERALVGTADAILRAVRPAVRALRRRPPRTAPRRILLMRIERIGDLLMSLEGIADVVAAAPGAEIDLVVGSWNAELATSIPGVHRVETMDASWLIRGGTSSRLRSLMAQARGWSGRQYDLAINFEPDIRSHFLMSASGAARLAGFSSGGGGPLLDVAIPFDPRLHTGENARRLAAAILDVPLRRRAAWIEVPADAKQRAADILGSTSRPIVGVHVSGGREIKQWPPERFAEIAARLIRERGATIVLTGSRADRPLVDATRRTLDRRHVLDLAGSVELLTLAAILQRLDALITGDTGPMHLAAAVGTPVVAIFGPSDPARYAPRDERHRVVRIDLPCSPCNRIRLPPQRCTGHTPACLAGVSVEIVADAVSEVLDAGRTPPDSSMPPQTIAERRTTAPGASATGAPTSAQGLPAPGTPHVAPRPFPRRTWHVAGST
jgi:ADP-heptose:LPS heptosyltransferase